MKEKILKIIEEKIALNFAESYLSKSTYDSQLLEFKEIIQEHYIKYDALCNEQNNSIAQINREDFITKNNTWKWKSDELKIKSPNEYERLSTKYDAYFEKPNRDHSVVLPFNQYVRKQLGSDDISNMFLDVFLETKKFYFWSNDNEVEEIVHRCSQNILSENKLYWDLLDNAGKFISKVIFGGFEECFVNIGSRNYSGHGRQMQNTIVLIDNTSKFPFTFYNDCEPITGIFVNVFILSKKELRKISFNDTQRIEDISINIYKDVQQVRVKGNCIVEIQRHKHFNPEIIICKDEDEGFALRDTINKYRINRQS